MRNEGYTNIEEQYKNEKRIKECEIRINDILYPFSYFFNFKQEGKYLIKYKFKNYLTNTNRIFCGYKSLTYLDLYNFNTQNVTNMEYMFYACESLTNLDFSNYNTQNVNNMERMFCECVSLKKGMVISKDYKILKQLKEDL